MFPKPPPSLRVTNLNTFLPTPNIVPKLSGKIDRIKALGDFDTRSRTFYLHTMSYRRQVRRDTGTRRPLPELRYEGIG